MAGLSDSAVEDYLQQVFGYGIDSEEEGADREPLCDEQNLIPQSLVPITTDGLSQSYEITTINSTRVELDGFSVSYKVLLLQKACITNFNENYNFLIKMAGNMTR